jgi:hypothetical protein
MRTSGRNPLKSRAGLRARCFSKTLLLAAMASATVALQGCGGSSNSFTTAPTASNPAPGVTLQAIKIAPATSLISIGENRQLLATGVYSNGSTSDLTSQVQWNASSAPSTTNYVTVNSKGMATGAAVGTSVVSATIGSVVGLIQLIVDANDFSTGTTAILSVPYKSTIVDAAYLPQQTMIQGTYAVQEVNLDADQFSNVLPVPLALLASIPMPAGFVPNATVAIQSSFEVAVISYSSPNVQIIDASNLSTDGTNNTVIATFTAPVSQSVTFNGITCMICAAAINPVNNQLLLSTAQGYYSMDLVAGTFEALPFTPPALPAPNFSLNPVAANPYILSPSPTVGELQFLNLATNSVSTINSGLTAPGAAAIDLVTDFAVVVDADASAQSVIDLTNEQSPVPVAVPGVGVCAPPPAPQDMNMVALGVSASAFASEAAHTLFTSQTLGNCVGFAVWPTLGNPLQPSQIYYGFGPMPDTPDGNTFVNGNDPNAIAAFNSVYGSPKNYGLLVDGNPQANQQWIAKINLAQVISNAGIGPGIPSSFPLPGGAAIPPYFLTATGTLYPVDIVFLPSPSTVITTSVNNINFGSLNVGTSSLPVPVTLANIGTSIVANQISVQGANAGDFLVTYDCDNILQPRTNCGINVSFSPTATSSSSSTVTENATLVIADNGGTVLASGCDSFSTMGQTVCLTGISVNPNAGMGSPAR